MEKIPQQIKDERNKDPKTGRTTEQFNSCAQDPSYWMAMEQLKRFPATISQPILQLMSEWSFLNYSGYRYEKHSPDCPVCSTPETTQHYILNCVVFNKQKDKIN